MPCDRLLSRRWNNIFEDKNGGARLDPKHLRRKLQIRWRSPIPVSHCIMASVDLNTCSVRQLTAIPGLQKPLADAILRYRENKGGEFRNIDELWRVDGMTRPKFQILKRHFSVHDNSTDPRSPHSSPHTARLARTAASFICKGQSVTASDGKHPPVPPGLTPRTSSPGSKTYEDFRPLARHRLQTRTARGQRHEAKGRVYSGVTGKQIYKKVNANNVSKETARALANGHKNILGNRTLGMQGALRRPRRPDRRPDSKRINCRDNQRKINVPMAETQGSGYYDSEDISGAIQASQHAFVLQPSASGNNINVTCTIEKRLLDNLNAPVAIRVQKSSTKLPRDDKRSPHEHVADTLFGAAPSEHCIHCHQQRSVEALKGKDCPHETSDYATGPPHSSNHQPSSDSGKVTNESNSIIYSLNVENLLRFDRMNRCMNGDKLQTMQEWVKDVNDSCLPYTKPPKENRNPVCLVSPGYLKEMVDECSPKPITQVRVETKPTKPCSVCPSQTARCSIEKVADETPKPASALSRPAPKSMKSASVLPRRPATGVHTGTGADSQISAVLRPRKPIKPSPAGTGDQKKLTPDRPSSSALDKEHVECSTIALPKSVLSCSKGPIMFGRSSAPLKCNRTTPNASSISKSANSSTQRTRDASRVEAKLNKGKPMARVGSGNLPRRRQTSNKGKQQSLISRIWEETQGNRTTLLRKPLQPSHKGKLFLQQFNFASSQRIQSNAKWFAFLYDSFLLIVSTFLYNFGGAKMTCAQ